MHHKAAAPDIFRDKLLEILRGVTGLGDDLRKDTTFDQIGLQSLAVVAFARRLETSFPKLPQSFIYDCRNIEDVAAYLLKRYPNEAAAFGALSQHQTSGDAEDDVRWPEFRDVCAAKGSEKAGAIAIIGMAGRFPGADTIAEFWSNLQRGVDSVREIPGDRWSMEGFFEPSREGQRHAGRSYCKWGGFLEHIDKFDAQFFGIAPREASLMDPQERIYLETAWHALEDAGLFGPRTASIKDQHGLNIGVFAGITTNTYLLHGPDRWRQGIPDIPTSMPWSAANRVSYFLDLCGPSLTVDTACSSSLVAIHLACESIRRGECVAALAGGANLYLHPAKYIQLCQQQMLSPSGHCHSFGTRADGFAPGEGVGVVVLKDLASARSDGDRIHAIIKGSATNHNGRTNGYTVPKAGSQSALIKQALANAGLYAAAVGCIEAHGTGTKLGDPIEVDGIIEAIGGDQPQGACAIGSVKSNIGHLESAAGVASLIKAVLQIKHQTFVPSLYSDEPNPALHLDDTRFFIPQRLTPWPRPELGTARCAGVSSFGAGGTNAHVIVQEAPEDERRTVPDGPHVFLFSARSNERLHAVALGMCGFLEAGAPPDLMSMAFTLQCARRHFEHRLAIVAHDARTLTSALRRFVDEGEMARKAGFIFMGGNGDNAGSEPEGDNESALAAFWCRGASVDWMKRWRSHPLPAQLPSYPFVRDRHWLSPIAEVGSEQKNTSHTISGDSTLISQHRINGHSLLPGTAFIACAYSRLSEPDFCDAVEFFDIRWIRPIASENGRDVTFTCRVDPAGAVSIESDGPEAKLCFRSSFRKTRTSLEPLITLEDAIARCSQSADVDRCYQNFERAEMIYGPRLRCLDEAWIGEGEALGLVRQHLRPGSDERDWTIDPALMDGALHTASLLISGNTLFDSPLVPVSASRVRLLKPLSDSFFAYVRERRSEEREVRRFDLVTFASDGDVLIEIEDIRFRKLNPRIARTEAPLQCFEWRWESAEQEQVGRFVGPAILFDRDSLLMDALKRASPGMSGLRLALPASAFEVEGSETITWDPTSPQHAMLLWRTLIAEKAKPRIIIFHVRADIAARGKAADAEPLSPDLLDSIEMLRTLLKASDVPRFHVLFAVTSRIDDHYLEIGASALAGLLRSLCLELPDLSASVLQIRESNIASVAAAVAGELRAPIEPGVQEIRKGKDNRRQRRVVAVTSGGGGPWPEFANDDFCVITGGTGAVGRSLARLLVRRGVKQLALLSRSSLDERGSAFLDELTRQGARAVHLVADCADADQLRRAFASVAREMGPPTILLHCAGILRDGFFTRQNADDLRAVSHAKIGGAENLDRLSLTLPIRWFILCSAFAGVGGNVGQCHYAFANGWIDRFAEWRQGLVDDGQRTGTTRSIAWPLWDTEDGMQASPQLLRKLNERGVGAISERDAEAILAHAFAGSTPVLIAGKGERAALADLLGATQLGNAPKGEIGERAAAPAAVARENQVEFVRFICEAMSQVTGTPLGKIDPDASMEVFGLDSIMVTELNSILEKHYPKLAKTAVFEARTINALASLIGSEYADEKQPAAGAANHEAHRSGSFEKAPNRSPASKIPVRHEDIAVIGLAGQYPGADTLEGFWRRLSEGADLVTDVPARWPINAADDKRIYALWGSFLDDFDKFDPLFFGISPRDAERMDPQERLFLQTAWHAVENAGYAPDRLSRGTEGAQRRVGVIVGVMYGEYQFYGASGADDDELPLTNSSYASIANRVSFCLDLDGPSFAVDSMCSSSLHAIQLGCDFIRSGTCDMVIAGGVNLSLHPYKYVTLCELGFAASDGKCHSFGQGGDGYVPGEGVGAVVLKSLAEAIRDGDHIHGVIRGGSLGHGGRTSGYTVPNVDAQADVVKAALKRSGVKAAEINYVEAHGTGTSLGDPIEIRGLCKAFVQDYPAHQKCPIGSIKSNIGHLESAAGIAALTKVLLQFRYRQIAPSIHAETLNPNINFGETPFLVQTTLTPWAASNGMARTAAISSFGAGGSNANLIVSEYQPDPVVLPTQSKPQVFVLSARNWKQLRAVSARLESYLSSIDAGECLFSAADVAATLFDGRRWNRCRCAVIASDLRELRHKLQRVPVVIRDPGPQQGRVVIEDQIFAAEAISGVAQRDDQSDLAEEAADWVKGARNRRLSSQAESYRKVALPGYEFEKFSFWITKPPRKAPKTSPQVTEKKAVLTPETILAQVDRGELSLAEAQKILERLLASEMSA